MTNEDFQRFDPQNRIGVDFKELKFLVLEQLAGKSEEFHEEMERRRKEAKEAKREERPNKKRIKLREPDPW